MSRSAANCVFLLPFWEALCSLLILLPSSCCLQKMDLWQSPLSFPKSYVQDTARMELLLFLAAPWCQVSDLGLHQCWQHTGALSPAEQCLQNTKTFLVSHSAPQQWVGWKRARGWEGTQVGPRGCSMTYRAMHSSNIRGWYFQGSRCSDSRAGIDLLTEGDEWLLL